MVSALSVLILCAGHSRVPLKNVLAHGEIDVEFESGLRFLSQQKHTA